MTLQNILEIPKRNVQVLQKYRSHPDIYYQRFSLKFSIACLATPFGLKPRITDGEDATPGEFPYQVSIRWGIPPLVPLRHACGGSILNEHYVLTAGHCILKIGKLKVFAGKHHISRDEDTQQEVAVERAIVHAQYPGYFSIIFSQK